MKPAVVCARDCDLGKGFVNLVLRTSREGEGPCFTLVTKEPAVCHPVPLGLLGQIPFQEMTGVAELPLPLSLLRTLRGRGPYPETSSRRAEKGGWAPQV